jgi:uncharacterized protein (DUF1501 family)
MATDRKGHADVHACACPQDGAAVSRRALLGGAGAMGALTVLGAAAGSLVHTQVAFAGPGYTGDTLVVLSLRGGFDGLSAVAPVADPAYHAARPTIGVPTSRALKLDSRFGLHPALAPLHPLYAAGKLAAVHAVGQPNPSRSHFAAMEDMERAAPGSSLRTGWIDRMVGLTGAAGPFAAAVVGATTASRAFLGPHPEITMASVDGFQLSGVSASQPQARWDQAIRGLYAGAPAVLAGPALATLASLGTTARLKAAGYAPAPGAAYPTGDLGSALRDVARLVKSGVGVRVAAVDIGDWDMHANLGASDSGWMFRKLTELGQALAAFAQDLGAGLDRVTLVTLSEFGRRVTENGSGGLDHGHGNVSLLLGGGVVGGKVHGAWPGLSASSLVNGDLAGTTDYRTILAEVLEKRCAVSASTVFPGLPSGRLGVVRPKA